MVSKSSYLNTSVVVNFTAYHVIVKIYNRYVVILAGFYTQDPLRFGRRNVRRGEMERDKVRERRECRLFQVVRCIASQHYSTVIRQVYVFKSFSRVSSLNIFTCVALFCCREEAGLSHTDTEEFCDSDNHGKVYEDEVIWKIVKIASRILGMIN